MNLSVNCVFYSHVLFFLLSTITTTLCPGCRIISKLLVRLLCLRFYFLGELLLHFVSLLSGTQDDLKEKLIR